VKVKLGGGEVGISEWLTAVKLSQYADRFLSRGYENLKLVP
jgi:hypothetical protein